MKLFQKIIISVFVMWFFVSFPTRWQWSWWKYGSSPIEILNEVNYKANTNWSYAVQETALDWVTAWNRNDRITATLEWIRWNISPYLQWAVYIWLSVAVVLLIYNGFLMVTGGLHDSGTFEKLKWNIINIWIWVLLLTWFYAIFKIIVAVVNAIFGTWSGF